MGHFRATIRRYPRLVITLAAIGIVAILVFLYIALVIRTGIPTPVSYDHSLSVRDPAFMSTLATITKSPIEAGQPVVILNNGDGFVPELITSIDSASSSINFSTYIWKKGEFSDTVFAALTRAAARGVTVRILFDGHSGNPPKDELQAFVSAGGHAATFRSFLNDPLSYNHRNHRRAIIIDDSIGYIGGIAVADTWLGSGKSEDQWRDTMFRLTGPMARSLDSAFDDQWLTTTGETIKSEPAPAGEDTTNSFVQVVGSAGDKNRPIGAAFLVAVESAQTSITITNPYFLPDTALLSVLEEKAREGVTVRILMPGPETDATLVRYASHSFYQDMLDVGIHIYEYQPSLIHSKALVVDGTFSLIGSANIDNRSRQLNDENVMGILDTDLAAALERTFERDLGESVEITPAAWKERSLLTKILTLLTNIPLKQY